MSNTATVAQPANDEVASGGSPMPYIYRAAEKFGVATVLLLAVLWYVRTDIIRPLLEAHYEFIGKIVAAQEVHTNQIKSVNDRLDEMIQIFRSHPDYRKTER